MVSAPSLEQLKDAAIKLAVSETLGMLVKELPFFGWAIIRPITGMVIAVVLEIAIKKTALGIKFLKIDAANAADAAKFEQVASINQQRQADPHASDAQKKASENEVIEAARKLLSLNH